MSGVTSGELIPGGDLNSVSIFSISHSWSMSHANTKTGRSVGFVWFGSKCKEFVWSNLRPRKVSSLLLALCQLWARFLQRGGKGGREPRRGPNLFVLIRDLPTFLTNCSPQSSWCFFSLGAKCNQLLFVSVKILFFFCPWGDHYFYCMKMVAQTLKVIRADGCECFYCKILQCKLIFILRASSFSLHHHILILFPFR